MSVFRVAILGSGIGREHLAAYLQLSDRYQVSVLCDTDTQRAEELVADNGGIRIASDWQTVVNDSSIDIVDVCLPPDLHFDVCMAALAAGKHVVCEKPLVSSLREADQLREQCTLSGKTLTPVFQYRYGPALAQLRALLKANLCGTPLVANIETHWHRDAEYYDNPWRGTWLVLFL